MVVLVVIRIVRVERVAIKLDVRLRFLDVQQRFLDAELLCRCILLLGSLGPVVSIIRDSDDDLLRGNIVEYLTQIFNEPVLCRDGARRGKRPVLVVIHQHNRVALLAEILVIVGIIACGQRDH